MVRPVVFGVMFLCLSVPALAQELPKFPKAGPPETMPEPPCDATVANNGDWLVGNWVSPHSRWKFTRQGDGLVWSLDRSGTINDGLGWSAGAHLDGTVGAVSACSFVLDSGNGQFVMNAVFTDGGKIYGAAANANGASARFLLRRER